MQNKSFTPENTNCEFHHITINDYKNDIMHVFIQPIVDDGNIYNINVEYDLVHEWLCFEGELFAPIETIASCCRLDKDLEMMTETNEWMENHFNIHECKKLAEWLFRFHNDRFNSETLYID